MGLKHEYRYRRTRSVVRVTALITVAMAVLLRVAPSPSLSAANDPVRDYPAVAAAIGLAEQLPPGSVLATYVYALGYGALEHVAQAVYPGTSALDFCVGFMRNPGVFVGLARVATAAAGVLAVCLLYVLLGRLIDPWAGIAAALLLAIHPTAVALSRSLTSDVFCLVCLLGGLIVFLAAARGSMRLLDFLPAGLLLGFATEAMPVAYMAVLALLGWLVIAAPAPRRLHALCAAAICAAAFALAALTVAQHLEVIFVTLVRAGVAAVVGVAALELLRHLRDSMPRHAWSSLILSGSVLVSAFGLSAPSAPHGETVSDPGVAAAAWIADNLPAGASIGLDAQLAGRVAIPRTEQSWRRELDIPESHRPHSLPRIAAGIRLAVTPDGPNWDVHFLTPPLERSPELRDLTGRPIRCDFVVVLDAPPGSARLADLGLWVVARFRPETGAGPGVAIWGAMPESAPVPPPSVRWHIVQAQVTS